MKLFEMVFAFCKAFSVTWRRLVLKLLDGDLWHPKVFLAVYGERYCNGVGCLDRSWMETVAVMDNKPCASAERIHVGTVGKSFAPE
jgi:hypothetical protein